MQIEHLEICNFLSYEHSELLLKDRGLLLVEGENRDQGGSNGAGKSTIFEAICWGLFGTLNNGLRGDDVIRFGSSGGTRVTLTLEVDGRKVFVARHRKHPEFQNQLHLELDGKDSRGATDRETQAKLLQLMHLDWSTFISVVLFPQGRQGIASWSDADQKSVLDTILNLDRFRRARERVMTMLTTDSAREQRLSIELREAVSALNAREDGLVTLLEQQAIQAAQRAETLHSLQENLSVLRSSEPSARPDLQQKVEELERALEESRQDDVHNLIDQSRHRLHVAERALAASEAKRSAMQRQLITTFIDPAAKLEQQSTCPSCEQMLPEEARASLLRTFEGALQDQHNHNESIHQTIEALTVEVAELTEKIRATHQVLLEAESSLTDLSGLSRELEDARAAVRENQRSIHEWGQSVQRAQMAVKLQEAKTDPFESLIVEARATIEQLKSKIELQEKELEPLRSDIATLNFWKKGFGNQGVKSLLMSTVTPFLNTRANVYMAGLSNDTAVIEINTQKQIKSGEFRDKFDFKVAYPNSGNLYQGKSGGETRRADISILFALGDLAATRASAPVRLRLLDEPFEALDALGCEQVVSLLTKHVVPESGTVLVMSHNDSMKSLFERRIVVIKERGISRIVDEAA